uniref:NADH-ubiquinone oxidoreductase chain 2 n=1 Tax=Regalecus glesne TaxID=81389 RepID=A0A6G7ISG5_REGGL|nr:NADH dehydrogenase subunit 2 [Regalecus russelii]QII41339.1 NADH dehydrogenase subunit 2 [Regalecus glesne]WJQ22793.1 NADH dehydrogenase subunit 2 [Regalecus russelii]BBG74566.1 NADH dehydrogenase subunit 2 [Regalecus glesne]
MSPMILTLLLLSLGLGTTITFASSHWLLAWMGLEINTLAILPLMAQNPHPRAVEATTKYFLTQATAAAVLLFASVTNAWVTGEWAITNMTSPLASSMVIMALCLKLGVAPVHFWLPEVLQGLDLTTGLILSTWQKLAPLALLIQTPLLNHNLIMILGVTSILIGGWGGLNQTQTRKILAYSSIAHLGWIVLISQYSPLLSVFSLATYILMTTPTFLILKMTSSLTINTLASAWTKAPLVTALAPLILFSLGGLPPLTGFAPKWLIIQELTKQQLPIVATLTAMAALLSLYFYLRLSYAAALTMSPNTPPAMAPWRMPPTQLSLPLASSAAFSLALLPLLPTLLTLFFL